MSLGLDLRGGVYVLLEVDMNSAVETRMNLYQQSIDDSLRGAKIRHRADLNDRLITVRLTSADDLEAARTVVQRVDPDVLVSDGTDGKSLTVRMSEAQIAARQDFAIEQNITTLRNRVNQLGVAEPLVQRQGVDRIVVQLPGVQDPNEINKILTATATLLPSLPNTTVMAFSGGSSILYSRPWLLKSRAPRVSVGASHRALVSSSSVSVANRSARRRRMPEISASFWHWSSTS